MLVVHGRQAAQGFSVRAYHWALHNARDELLQALETHLSLVITGKRLMQSTSSYFQDNPFRPRIAHEKLLQSL